jgi:signal transduction histidine kinase
MTLRAKLLLAQLPLALSLVLVGAVSRKTVQSLDFNAQDILKDNYLSVLAAQRMRDSADALADAALSHVRNRPVTANLDRLRQSFEHELQFQEGNITEPGEREMTARLRQSWSRLRAELDGIMQSPDDESRYFDNLRPLLAEVHSAANDIVSVNQDAMVRKSDRARRSAERNSALMLGVTVGAFLLGIIASVYLTNRLTRPLFILTQAVRRLGEGDLAARVRLEGRDEIAQVARELNTMAERLAEYRSSSLGELLQAQQSSQAAIDSLPDPVLVLKWGGTLLIANHAAEELFNVTVEASGDQVLASSPLEVRMLVNKMKEHISLGRGPYVPKGLEEAVPIATRDGTHYFLARANPVVDEENRPLGLTILFQDVTRLRRFDELKTDMVATVAHEFRTPLTSLRMAIHLCAEGTVGPLTPKQADLLFAARDDCERLQSIVDDLLDLSRIQAGKIDLHRRSVSAASLLAEAVDKHRAAAEEKGVVLELSPLTVDRPVLADPDRVQLVLSNLIENALRATPADGRISLRAAPEDKLIRFEVSDTGPGIPPEYQPHLFQRFFRLPNTPAGGAGLGLYICKEIVESHGGRIGVESDPGHGAIFWFTLPAAAPATADEGWASQPEN